MRHMASSGVDVYTSVAGATAALYGPRHGGANAAVLTMLEGIGSVADVPRFIQRVKERKAMLVKKNLLYIFFFVSQIVIVLSFVLNVSQ